MSDSGQEGEPSNVESEGGGLTRRETLAGASGLALTGLLNAGGLETGTGGTNDVPRDHQWTSLRTHHDTVEPDETADEEEGERSVRFTAASSLTYLGASWSEHGRPGDDTGGMWQHTFVQQTNAFGTKRVEGDYWAPAYDANRDPLELNPASDPEDPTPFDEYYGEYTAGEQIGGDGPDDRGDVGLSDFEVAVSTRTITRAKSVVNGQYVSVGVRRDPDQFGFLDEKRVIAKLLGHASEDTETAKELSRALSKPLRAESGQPALGDEFVNVGKAFSDIDENWGETFVEGARAGVPFVVGFLSTVLSEASDSLRAELLFSAPATILDALTVTDAFERMFSEAHIDIPTEVPYNRGFEAAYPGYDYERETRWSQPDYVEENNRQPVAGHYVTFDVYVQPNLAEEVSADDSAQSTVEVESIAPYAFYGVNGLKPTDGPGSSEAQSTWTIQIPDLGTPDEVGDRDDWHVAELEADAEGPDPIAGLEIFNRKLNDDEPTTFDARTTMLGGAPLKEEGGYEWQLYEQSDDETESPNELAGASGTGQRFTYDFASNEGPGNYVVELTVTDTTGASNTTKQPFAVVDGDPPKTELSVSNSGEESNRYRVGDTLTLQPDVDPKVNAYKWTFPEEDTVSTTDQGTAGESGASASFANGKPKDRTYTPESEGTKTVVLTTRDVDGNEAQCATTFAIANANPDVDFESSPPLSSITYGQEVSFDAGATSDPDGDDIAEYRWTFRGPLGTSQSANTWTRTGETTTFTFDPVTTTDTAAQKYEVTLEAVDGNGNDAVLSRTVEVTANEPPEPAFNAPESVRVGEQATLNASPSKDEDGLIESYEWTVDVGDGSYEETGRKVKQRWDEPGSYTVSLTVTDNDGGTATTERTVDVVESNESPNPIIQAPSSVRTGESVTLDGTESFDSDGSIERYEWTVTSGDTVFMEPTGSTATVEFSAPGWYEVELAVTDDDGATATESTYISVQFDWGFGWL